MASIGHSLGWQLLERQPKKLSDKEFLDKLKSVEAACKRFDKSGKNRLSMDDFYNVLKVQNKIDCSKEELKKLLADLDMDKEGKVSIKDFFHHPIFSESVFATMDRNKDGYISKGELKLAQKNLSMQELNEILAEIDNHSEGKLTYEDVKAISKRALERKKEGGHHHHRDKSKEKVHKEHKDKKASAEPREKSREKSKKKK